MQNRLPCIFAILGLFLCGCASNPKIEQTKWSENALLELNLTMDKQAYGSGEKVFATLNLVNTGTNDVIVKNRMVPGLINGVPEYRDVAFFITNSNNKKIPFIGRIRVKRPQKEIFIALSHGQSIESTIEISSLYYFFNDAETSTRQQYSIYAVYYNDLSLPDYPIPWLGEIESNVVNFDFTFK